MAQLALAAWQDPVLREIVSCRERVAQVHSVQGYQRNVLWKNTNQLLGQTGFQGMKTGTTEAAGACLIAIGAKHNQSANTTAQEAAEGRQQRIVVVLGSVNSEARYVDARNLFAWTWRTAE